MLAETALLWWSLGILTRKRYEALLQLYGSLDEASPDLGVRMLQGLRVQEKILPEVLERLTSFDPIRIRQDMEKHGVTLINIEDDIYPSLLREIPDHPVFISYIGDLSVLDRPCIGVVGTRRMSPYGRRVVELFVNGFVRSGVTTVSGLALGVDAAVAKDTVTAGGKTVAVLGHGLGMIHPKSNEELARKIVTNGGLLISEFALYRPPDVYTFPARNRIIGGLSAGTLVCEAPEDSGAIITAELALEYGRDVFAVPGQIFDDQFGGCHRIVSKGHARLVTKPEDVLAELGMVPSENEASNFIPAEGDEQTVFAALSAMPCTVDDLIESTSLTTARIGTALTMMELAGAVRNIGEGQWIRR